MDKLAKNALVYGFGSLVVDVLMTADGIRMNRKNFVDFQTIQVGGVIPTALIVLSRLGIQTQLHTVVGDDFFADALFDILKKENVGYKKVIRIENKKTPFACVILQKRNGNRTSFYTTGHFSSIESKYTDFELDTKTTICLIDCHNLSLSTKCIHKAKEKNIPILLDLGSPKAGSEALIKNADIVIVPSLYWKTMYPGKKPESIIHSIVALGARKGIVTMEEKGCMLGSKDTVLYQEAYKVNSVDTNGAGDIFFGAFTYGLLQKWEDKKILQFASAAAAFSCTKIGKDQKIPRSEKQITAFIQMNSKLSI
jgi:sulfofructose kinase